VHASCACCYSPTQPQSQYNGRTEALSGLNSELHRISDQLAAMKGVMDEHSSNISDATPVVGVLLLL
jgi:hypothetical protein